MEVSKTLFKFFLFISFYLLISAFAELVIVYDTKFNDGDLSLYILSIFLSILIVFFLGYKRKQNKIFRFEKIISNKLLLIVSFFSFLLFIYFVSKYAKSLVGLVNFAYLYRNGFLKGSGIYTTPILTLLPSILVLIILKQKKMNWAVFVSFLLVLIATIIIGLRIYLFGIIFSYLLRLFSVASYKKIIITLSLFVFIMVGFKFYLNKDTDGFADKEKTFYFLGRLNLRTLLEFPGFEKEISDFKCAFFPINFFYECNNASFKEDFIKNNEDIHIGMSYIGSFSGIALPFTVISYNTFGLMSFSVISIYFLFLLKLFEIVLRTKKIILAAIVLNLAIIFTSALVEDINILNKIPIMVLICFIYSYYFKKYTAK